MDQNPGLPKRSLKIFISIAISLFILVVLSTIIGMYMYNLKQQEIIQTTDKFMNFKSQIERLVFNNKTLIDGFEAYINVNPDLNEEEAYIYLENLLSKNDNQVRNIGVIQDTTIIWNYPKEANSVAIGVDLGQVDNQKDLIFAVKNELKPMMQGPVELVQGGTGFIMRLPIVYNDTEYWGQISVVLVGEKVIKEIDKFAEEAALNVAIFNDNTEVEPFYGSKQIVGNEFLTFDIEPELINWHVIVSPVNGWTNNWFMCFCLIIIALVLSFGSGFITYKTLKANEKLRLLSSHDSLTGLYNRHYLNEYQNMVLALAERNNEHVGFMSMDLNRFKKINDTYGHNVGDMVLVETARILRLRTRKNEAAFRLGGDEFLIILPEIKDRKTLLVARERLTECFEKEFNLNQLKESLTLSIGTSLFPDDGDNIDVLLHVSDIEMYEMKKSSYQAEEKLFEKLSKL
ncbi:diguanylate cyclase [Eubacteriaceae bacterium ES3]|nr:diguanylate cyclase [Eubacteriaceae bacterium ES3]